MKSATLCHGDAKPDNFLFRRIEIELGKKKKIKKSEAVANTQPPVRLSKIYFAMM